MSKLGSFVLFSALLVLSGGAMGDASTFMDEPKQPTTGTKEDPPVKLKGRLPNGWTKLGLTDKQVQEIYKVQNKHNEEIDKLKARIKELEGTRDKDMKAVLTPEQLKRLEEITPKEK